jgi:hypothetical protein
MKTGWTRSRGSAGCLGWFLLIALVVAVIAWTHGLILIPVIIAGAVLAIRRGKISKTPGLAIAAVLVALTAIVAGLTFAGSGHASASQAPASAASTQAPATHAPATQAPATHAPATHAPKPATVTQAPATPAPAPAAPSPSPTITQSAAPPPAPATSAAAPPPASCSPLTNGGNCYEPGEYCRNSDHGMYGVAGDGEKIACEDNNGWRWEPV